MLSKGNVRAADAKEVGVENPAEETSRNPDRWSLETTSMVSMHGFEILRAQPPACL
jgi:hypothetical protein